MTTPIDRCPGDESLQAFLEDGGSGLEPGERTAVAAHAAVCARCAGRLADYRRLDAALRGAVAGAEEELRPGFSAETVRLAAGRPRARAVAIAAAAAAVAALVAVASRFIAAPPAGSFVESAVPRFATVGSLDLDPRSLGESAKEGLAAGLEAIRVPAEPAAAHAGGIALAAASLNGLALWLVRRGRGEKGSRS